MKFLKALFSAWTWRMAWHDSRASRRRLVFFVSSIVIGIAALVALGSFGANLKSAIGEQAKGLLGADLVLTARDPFTTEMEELFAEIGGSQTREVLFSSMVYFPKSDGTRLAQVRALGEGFPYYGAFETEPPPAGTNFVGAGQALVDETMLLQYGAQPGDAVKIGEREFTIAGALRKVPGETMVFATIAPRVYIPFSALPATQLFQGESLARFNVYFKLPEGADVEAVVRKYRPRFTQLELRVDTVEERKRSVGRRLENLDHFLNMGGFIALLLGAIGVASGIQVHVKQKAPSIAVLRCLGASVSASFAVYLAQAMALGVFGALCGGALGLFVQAVLPQALGDFLPFPVELKIYWWPVLEAMGVGFTVCLMFALWPLLGLRKITPLAVLRNPFAEEAGRRDPAVMVLVLAILAGLFWFAWLQTHRIEQAAGFAGGLALSFALLAGAAKLLRGAARRLVGRGWPYIWRQGLANLYRPQNRTLLLLVSLGLGTFLVLTVYLTHRSLTTDLFPESRKNEPNAALFDIQPDQLEGVRATLAEQRVTVLDHVPIVTMRLAALKGETVTRLLRGPRTGLPRWALRREYRSTWRDTLAAGEETVAGAWPAAETKPEAPPLSIEEDIARDLKLGLGDEVVVNIQGVMMTNTIAHIRKVDWRQMRPNFFLVFPPKVLQDAPGTHILTARLDSREHSAAMQRTIVQKFPNVSAIDLALVLDTLDAILGKIGFVIRFMALFTLVTGVIVLVAAIMTGRFQRVQESTLLRTLGASRQQVQRILLVEYLLLGLLSAATGILLAVGGAWALATFLFKVGFSLPVLPLVASFGAVSALTVAVGLLSNRGVLDSPPLEILRQG